MTNDGLMTNPCHFYESVGWGEAGCINVHMNQHPGNGFL
jgi:hypothetical protein